MPDEELLTGGNTTTVRRVGNTVRRPIGHWTPAVHHVLRHLESVGFDGAPRVLGVDEQDREILRYVDGEVGTLSETDPLSPWFRGPEACWTAGRWIRDFQRAQATLELDPRQPWRLAPGRRLGAGEVLVHHDVSSYNTVRRADGSIVVLDWDFARPGRPVEDLAWAAWRWAPLMAGTWRHVEFGLVTGEDTARRQRANLAALLDGYEPSREQRAEFSAAVGEQMLDHAADLEKLAESDPAFRNLVDRDYAKAARADAAWWSEQHRKPAWRAALGT